MKTLIYSFEAFKNLKSNPAYELSKNLIEKSNPDNIELIQLPVSYDCWSLLKNKIQEFQPNFILGIGVAVGINKLRIEKLGLNYKYAKIPDNKGKTAKAEKIEEKGKLAYETDINVLDFVDSLTQKQIPCEISFNAGTYICN